MICKSVGIKVPSVFFATQWNPIMAAFAVHLVGFFWGGGGGGVCFVLFFTGETSKNTLTVVRKHIENRQLYFRHIAILISLSSNSIPSSVLLSNPQLCMAGLCSMQTSHWLLCKVCCGELFDTGHRTDWAVQLASFWNISAKSPSRTSK